MTAGMSFRRMAQVGVHHAEHVAGGRGEPGHHGAAQAELARPVHDADRKFARQAVCERPGAVRGIVVDDDELRGEMSSAEHVEDGPHELFQALALVVSRDDDRDRRVRRHGGLLGGPSRPIGNRSRSRRLRHDRLLGVWRTTGSRPLPAVSRGCRLRNAIHANLRQLEPRSRMPGMRRAGIPGATVHSPRPCCVQSSPASSAPRGFVDTGGLESSSAHASSSTSSTTASG